MHLYVYNTALLLGWLLVLVGGVLLHPAAGLVAAGLLLLILVFLTVWLGGVYAADKDRG
jgi:hypothetical membrane protein